MYSIVLLSANVGLRQAGELFQARDPLQLIGKRVTGGFEDSPAAPAAVPGPQATCHSLPQRPGFFFQSPMHDTSYI